MARQPNDDRTVVKFVRSKNYPRGYLVDPDLRVLGLEEAQRRAATGRGRIVVIDADTGEDITRIMLAHWEDGRPVVPSN